MNVIMQVETESENGCVLVVEDALTRSLVSHRSASWQELPDRRGGPASPSSTYSYSNYCVNLRYDPHTDARHGPDGGWPGVGIRLTFLANSCVGGSSGTVLGVFGGVFHGSKFWKAGSLTNRRLENGVGPTARHPKHDKEGPDLAASSHHYILPTRASNQT